MSNTIDKDRESIDRKIDKAVNKALRANAPGKKNSTAGKNGQKSKKRR